MSIGVNKLAIISALLTLGGCCKPLKPPAPPIRCEIPPERLAEQCAAPTVVAANATYSDVLNDYLVDRQSLKFCKDQHEFLKQQINACNAALKKYAADIAQIYREAEQARK